MNSNKIIYYFFITMCISFILEILLDIYIGLYFGNDLFIKYCCMFSNINYIYGTFSGNLYNQLILCIICWTLVSIIYGFNCTVSNWYLFKSVYKIMIESS